MLRSVALCCQVVLIAPLLLLFSFVATNYHAVAAFHLGGDQLLLGGGYNTNGFRGLPFFRFGLECDSGQSEERGTGGDLPACAVLTVDLQFHDVPHQFAQVLLYQADVVEWSAFADNPSAHVCMPAGQLFGAPIFENTSHAAFTLDSTTALLPATVLPAGGTSSDYGNADPAVRVVSGRITINTPGLYIVYPHVCAYSLDDDDDGDDNNDASQLQRHSNNNNNNNGQRRRKRTLDTEWANASITGTIHVKTAASGFLPSQVAPLLPTFIAFAIADLVMIMCFAVGGIIVGRQRLLKYQMTLLVVIALDLCACAAFVIFLRYLRDEGKLLGNSVLLFGVVAAAGRDSIARTLLTFILFGVGLVRHRFTVRVSSAIVILAVIYFVFRVVADRSRFSAELSLGPLHSPGLEQAKSWTTSTSSSSPSNGGGSSGSSHSDDSSFLRRQEQIALAVVESVLVVFLLAAARHTLLTFASGETRKKAQLRRTTIIVVCLAVVNLVWKFVEVAYLHLQWRPASTTSERNWRMWSLVEIVPGVALHLGLVAFLVLWFPSRESIFWVLVADDRKAVGSGSSGTTAAGEENEDQQQAHHHHGATTSRHRSSSPTAFPHQRLPKKGALVADIDTAAVASEDET